MSEISDRYYIKTAGSSAYGINHNTMGSGLIVYGGGTRRVPVDPDVHVLHTVFF